MEALPLAAAGVIGYFLYDKYILKQQSAQVNAALVPSATTGRNLPRGIRNNNPGNIKYNSANAWEGQVGKDGPFIIFDNPINGLRAVFRILATYIRTHKLDTIGKIAPRYEGTIVGTSGVYGANVAKYSRVAQNVPLVVAQGPLTAVVKGIIAAENGAAYLNYYTPDILAQAWQRSGL